MGRAPCCEKVGLKKGRWTKEEDEILARYIKEHGEGSWRSLPKNAGTEQQQILLAKLRFPFLVLVMMNQSIFACLLQGCCGAGRAAGCGGSTT
jgi:hypothetical protein